MKKIIIIILFIVGCSSNSSEKNIPSFDENSAFQHLLDQCSFGPMNPGSEGHERFSEYLESYLLSLSPNVIVQEFSYLEHLTETQREGKNLIAQFNLESNERLLLGAHCSASFEIYNIYTLLHRWKLRNSTKLRKFVRDFLQFFQKILLPLE